MHSRQDEHMIDAKKKTIELSSEQSFEEVLELVQPMITTILLKCHVYKNYDYYRHIAAIGVWEAWQKADPAKGAFSSYIYTTVKGRIMQELTIEKRYLSNYTLMEGETLNIILTRNESMEGGHSTELVEMLFEFLQKEEIELLQLLYIDGYSYIEIAQQLSVSVDAVKKRRMRLMTKIRGLIDLS
ncbi:sigma-70 family RNA polymerase sigma factor [Lysinibacillus sp. NPDC097287]|uniref:sigma-70 family RNA polymerase sigma factor n=1 Tax=Lysinibacillus sp. NPDC097287 TaxID=3364144 RepID=UPI00380AEFBA